MTADITYRADDVLLSQSLRSQGKFRKALEAARRAEQQRPGDPRVLEALAEAQLACVKATEAGETASRLIQLVPESAAAYDLRGRVDLKRRRFIDAEALFRQALTLDPNRILSMNNLGVALRGQNREKEAIAAFEAAWRANPNSRSVRRNLFTATQAYVGAGGALAFVFWFHFWPELAQAAKLAAAIEDLGFLGGMVLTIAGFWWFGVRRRRTLSPEVDRFYRREVIRERNLELVSGLFKAGPLAIIALGLVALINSGSPGTLIWILVGTLAWIAWLVIGPRLWRRYLLPRLRP